MTTGEFPSPFEEWTSEAGTDKVSVFNFAKKDRRGGRSDEDPLHRGPGRPRDEQSDEEAINKGLQEAEDQGVIGSSLKPEDQEALARLRSELPSQEEREEEQRHAEEVVGQRADLASNLESAYLTPEERPVEEPVTPLEREELQVAERQAEEPQLAVEPAQVEPVVEEPAAEPVVEPVAAPDERAEPAQEAEPPAEEAVQEAAAALHEEPEVVEPESRDLGPIIELPGVTAEKVAQMHDLDWSNDEIMRIAETDPRSVDIFIRDQVARPQDFSMKPDLTAAVAPVVPEPVAVEPQPSEAAPIETPEPEMRPQESSPATEQVVGILGVVSPEEYISLTDEEKIRLLQAGMRAEEHLTSVNRDILQNELDRLDKLTADKEAEAAPAPQPEPVPRPAGQVFEPGEKVEETALPPLNPKVATARIQQQAESKPVSETEASGLINAAFETLGEKVESIQTTPAIIAEIKKGLEEGNYDSSILTNEIMKDLLDKSGFPDLEGKEALAFLDQEIAAGRIASGEVDFSQLSEEEFRTVGLEIAKSLGLDPAELAGKSRGELVALLRQRVVETAEHPELIEAALNRLTQEAAARTAAPPERERPRWEQLFDGLFKGGFTKDRAETYLKDHEGMKKFAQALRNWIKPHWPNFELYAKLFEKAWGNKYARWGVIVPLFLMLYVFATATIAIKDNLG